MLLRVAPTLVEYVPAPHAEHVLAWEAADAPENVPAEHDWQVELVAAPLAVEYRPAAHAVQDALAARAVPVEKVPAVQGWQVELVTAPLAVEYRPVPQARQSIKPSPVPYVPAEQDAHPSAVMYVPAPQTHVLTRTLISIRPEPPFPPGELSAPPPPPLPVFASPSSEAALADPLYPLPPPPVPPKHVLVVKEYDAGLQHAPPAPPPAIKFELATLVYALPKIVGKS